MNDSTLRALEFDRVVEIATRLAMTPPGRARLETLRPTTDARAVVSALKATTEATRFLATRPGFPLRAPSDLDDILSALAIEGRALEPVRLHGLATYLESIEHSRTAVRNAGGTFPILEQLVTAIASFQREVEAVRRAIDAAGEVVDNASPALASVRDKLRRQRARLRSTLESFLRERETSKYLQEHVVTDRNGRYVLVVRAEHRSAIPGIVHGASASGASLFLEPLTTVDINNDIVALEEQEAEEVRRILLALTDAFRNRSEELEPTLDAATELDVVQARGRLSQMLGGVEPGIAMDGTFELHSARHPLLLLRGKGGRVSSVEDTSNAPATSSEVSSRNDTRPPLVVPIDVLLTPPTRILVITGPNTGGKTVALKTAGLLAAMAQAGLHIPADEQSRLPIFKSVFADIGDEQSISASLSTFSGHITNVISMDRNLALPALVLLDEVGAGTDPIEGGALGIAVIDHFRSRGAHLIATTHYDSLKSYASTTPGVASAAFGFNRTDFAPTYKLVYGSPGRSLAIEIAARLGMPASVIAAARGNLTEPEKQLTEHLARVDRDLGTLEQERRTLHTERRALVEVEQRIRSREDSVRQREEALRKRLNAKLDDQVKDARRQIDTVIDDLKTRAAELAEAAARQLRTDAPRLRRAITTGDTGTARAEARAKVDALIQRLKNGASEDAPAPPPASAPAPLAPGARVIVGALGLEGTLIELHGTEAEVDVRGKRLRTPQRDLRAVGAPDSAPRVRINVDLQPRETSVSELNVIGCTVDDALARTEKFLDEATITDQRTVRIVHGHGTGQLRRAVADFLRDHPMVAHFELAPQNQGGGGATVVELKD